MEEGELILVDGQEAVVLVAWPAGRDTDLAVRFSDNNCEGIVHASECVCAPLN